MAEKKSELLPGTLDLLVLKSLSAGPMHGYAIVRHIQQRTSDVLAVEEGTLYPALHRMHARGWLRAEWGASESNRRAKYYALTPRGKRRLASEVAEWERVSGAIGRVLGEGAT
jgi:transcriptional regulator